MISKRRKYPCIDCGKPCIGGKTQRCVHCAGKSRRKPANFCIDCGKPADRRATRCKHCNMKRLATIAGNSRWHGGAGEKHNQWKGGRFKEKTGYILVYAPGHPRAFNNHIREHLFIWEQANSKPLPKGWVIHHLNGIKHDNRIQNLIALPNRKHYLVLAAKAKRIQELEALLNNQHQLL